MTAKTAKKILIIEDETMLQEALVENLTSEGFFVRGCVNSEIAFEMIGEEKPDIILTDLVLPGVDGFEIIRRLKADPVLKDIPVLVLSNLGENEDIEKAKALGAQEFLIKADISLKEVTKHVKKILTPKKKKKK